MKHSLNQPNFFEGQMIGPDELNRLAKYATDRAALPLGLLSGKGGILRLAGSELFVAPASKEGLELKVSSGAALSKNGYLYRVEEPLSIQLEALAPIVGSGIDALRTLFVYLIAKEELSEKISDREIPEIEGFLSRSLSYEVVVSDRELTDESSVELCRVTLSPDTHKIIPFETRSENISIQIGQIDLRYRRYIALLSGRQLPLHERQELISGVRRTRGILVHLGDAFQVALSTSVAPVCVGLEVELSRDNLEEGSLRVLLNEGLESMATMLEEVRSLVTIYSVVERRTLVESVLEELAKLKTQPIDVIVDLKKALTLLDVIDEKLLGMSELKLKIMHAFSLMRQRPFVQSKTFAPAGRVVHLRDTVFAKDAGDHLKVSSPKSEKMTMVAKGAVAPGETVEALAIEGGDLEVTPKNLIPGKDLLVVGRTYKRRRPVEVAYEWNGVVVHEEVSREDDSENGISLFGFIVPAKLVSASDNRVRVKVNSFEVQYPFLGLAFYQ